MTTLDKIVRAVRRKVGCMTNASSGKPVVWALQRAAVVAAVSAPLSWEATNLSAGSSTRLTLYGLIVVVATVLYAWRTFAERIVNMSLAALKAFMTPVTGPKFRGPYPAPPPFAFDEGDKPSVNKYLLTSFARGVNEYFHHYVNAADAKAGSTLLIALPVIGLLLNAAVRGGGESAARWAAIALLCLAVFFALRTLYPRLDPRPQRKARGYIFWEGVARFEDAERYAAAVAGLKRPEITHAFCVQNFHLSRILCAKYFFLRCSIGALTVGLAVSAIVLGLR